MRNGNDAEVMRTFINNGAFLFYMSYLILVRHGESRWNKANKFTGWVDVPLSKKGVEEALKTAKELRTFTLDIAFTSTLKRAQETLLLILADQNYTGIFQHKGKRYKHLRLEQRELPVHTSQALNERYYGKLQGMNKHSARRQFGKEKVLCWRRSFREAPPGGESLHDTYTRVVPYFRQTILPFLKDGKNVIVSAHGNSLRALVKHLEGMTEKDIPHLNLPTGKPLWYKYAHGKYIHDHTHSFDRPLCWTKKCRIQ